MQLIDKNAVCFSSNKQEIHKSNKKMIKKHAFARFRFGVRGEIVFRMHQRRLAGARCLCLVPLPLRYDGHVFQRLGGGDQVHVVFS